MWAQCLIDSNRTVTWKNIELIESFSAKRSSEEMKKYYMIETLTQKKKAKVVASTLQEGTDINKLDSS
jgi:hypothetical protein